MSRRYLYNLFLFMCAIAVLATSVFIGRNVSETRALRAAVKAQHQRLDEINQQAAVILQSLDLYAKEEKEFGEYLFNEKDVPSFLESIAQYAQQAGVNVIDMKTQRFQEVDVKAMLASSTQAKKGTASSRKEAEVSAEDAKKIFTLAAMPITFRVEGPFASFIEFLGYLEEFRQLITISSIQIASGKKYPVLECSFTLKIYSLKTLEELEYR